MKTFTTVHRSVVLLLSAAASACVASAASSSGTAADAAARTLVSNGSVSVAQVGPYVTPGTFRVQVSTKLGRPDLILADGTWLYHRHRIERSEAEGTLVVRFTGGRVSSLALVTPTVAAALHRDAEGSRGTGIVARK